MILSLERLLGLPLEDALARLEGQNAQVTCLDRAAQRPGVWRVVNVRMHEGRQPELLASYFPILEEREEADGAAMD